MTTIELRTSILADLEQMSVEMLENVSHYVKRLRRHARPVRQTATKEKSEVTDRFEQIEITPGVARLSTGKRWNVSDEELDRLRYEYLMEKYK